MQSILMQDFEELLHSELDLEPFRGKIFFVTGATGLVGSLVLRFLAYANEQLDLDLKLLALVRNKEKAQRLYAKYKTAPLKFVVTELGHSDLHLSEKVDYVIHAAAVTGSKQMIADPVGTIRTALWGTDEVLQEAVRNNAEAMVYLSSMEVYGQPVVTGQTTEKDLGYVDLTNIRSSYPEGKRMSELMCNSYAEQYGLRVMSARLAQVFGAGVLPGENRVFAQFARSAMNGENIVLHTTGQSEGNYVYATDAIKAILILLQKGETRQAYNVANEDSHMTIKAMAEMVMDNFGISGAQVVIDIPKENMGYAPDVKMWLSSQKLQQLGWRPTVNLKDSYARLIQWLQEKK
ncbi:NAD(P)-dependent oxidoreductase [Ligilactobacillus saerimneri]|uniref:NAD-dependent epimerase/dehydratase family protein n=1 Tax=Ligilactobacillus saerimneri TaxID=228229 RepID=UPI0030D212D4